ncbi:periplasmic chaperone for outer membrane proteins SurA [Prevotella sp. tc2-28]|uniref:peptidylprolyl isomerase n=1 Tax=Prevotella sp. tc2-28 TaxID=1761888 RepID=UPI0008973C57|nr:peptidylprolyl isomerase [Prevotella sp. tc2-28]SEA84313.1 periplasmic chaperone for outer membrane proteins SurA [Prevotella sp. tc2-28]
MNKRILVLLVQLISLVSLVKAQQPADSTVAANPTGTVVDEVIWVVGDEAILMSDVEAMRIQGQQEGLHWSGNPDCSIPEQIAVQKLYLNQAIIDSIQVTDAEIAQAVEQYLDNMINAIGSREKLEEYHKKNISQIRADLRESYRERQLVQGMQQKLVQNITVSPAEVRRYFKDLPQDSLPFVPTEVEVQILTQQPKVEQEEINRVKDELRNYTDRINKGEASFQTLARLYSEDPGTARRGGELDYTGRGMLDPAFANVAFGLTDPKRVSKIVESEFGFHIIQLIDKRGDKIKVRHILRKPVVSDDAVTKALARLDSIRTDIVDGKFTFDAGASIISDDKDTRNNHGLMANVTQEGRTSRFKMADLPAEVAKAVDTLSVGAISKPFMMINERGKTVCAIAKLKNRIDGHKATITEDFQVMKNLVLNKRRNQVLHDWVVKRIKSTYVRINDRYRDCQFEYEGWVR